MNRSMIPLLENAEAIDGHGSPRQFAGAAE